MPFLPPNQHRQSTEGLNYKHWLHIDTRCVHVSVERQWLPPRSAHHRNADCDLFTARHTVVRRGNCSLYQPHSQSHSWIRMRCTWRETEIPWCSVSLQISYLLSTACPKPSNIVSVHQLIKCVSRVKLKSDHFRVCEPAENITGTETTTTAAATGQPLLAKTPL